jgi:hypothetical protein
MVSAFPQEDWERLEDMPQATNYYGSCFDSISEKAYIFGGQPPSEMLELLATTQIYDFKTDKWSLGANMLNAASSFSAEIVNGKIYLESVHKLFQQILCFSHVLVSGRPEYQIINISLNGLIHMSDLSFPNVYCLIIFSVCI